MQKGWVYEPVISTYELLLFHNTIGRHGDPFYYIPIAIAKREETGMKYHYLCIAKQISFPGSSSHFTNIEIYKPPLGEPYVTALHKFCFDQFT